MFDYYLLSKESLNNGFNVLIKKLFFIVRIIIFKIEFKNERHVKITKKRQLHT